MLNYVRMGGNDGSATGGLDHPYGSIGAAVLAAAAGDTIDVGIGSFQESLAHINVPITIRGVVGQTRWQPTAVNNQGSALILDSGLNSQVGTIEISGIMWEPQVSGFRSLVAVNGVPSGHTYFTRSAFRFLGDEYGFVVTDGNAGRVVLLNSVFTIQGGNIRGRAVRHSAGANLSLNRTVMLNCILANLSCGIDDGGARPISEDWNCFYNNDRDIAVAAYGVHDIQGNPLWKNPATGDFSLQRGSPCIDAGLNLGVLGVQTESNIKNPDPPFDDGQLKDSISVPAASNWGSSGDGLDIGLLEYQTPSVTKVVNTYVTHTILSAFGQEAATVRSLLELERGNKFLERATSKALQARWGDLFGVERPPGFSRNNYEQYIRDLAQATSEAPTWRAALRAVNGLFGANLVRYDYNKNRRWQLGKYLKLVWARTVDPHYGPLDVMVTPGEFRCLCQWFRTVYQRVSVPDNGVYHIYMLPTNASCMSPQGQPTLQVATALNEECLEDETWFDPSNIQVLMTEGNASVASSTNLPIFQTVQAFSQLLLGNDNNRYTIQSIQSPTELTLTEQFTGETQTVNAQLGYPVVSIGKVVTAGGKIQRIGTHSRLGQSAFADSILSRAHTYEMQLTGPNGIATIFG